MKKILFALFVGLSFTMISCSDSPEKRADKLIIPYMQDSFNNPSIYEPIKTLVDTAYAPIDDYSLISDVMSLFDSLQEQDMLGQKVNTSKDALDSATEENNVWRDYRYSTDVWNLTNKIKENIILLDVIVSRVKFSKVLPVGFKAQHVYRINIPEIKQHIYNSVFYFNNDISDIVGYVDLEDEQYQKALKFLWSVKNGDDDAERLRDNLESILDLFE